MSHIMNFRAKVVKIACAHIDIDFWHEHSTYNNLTFYGFWASRYVLTFQEIKHLA